MKKIFIITLIGSMFFMLTVLTAGEDEKKNADFFRLNENIQNEDLRVELAKLRKEFDIERSQILEGYKEKMEVLKASRKDEVQKLKNDFADRREFLLKEYPPKKREKPKMANPAIKQKDDDSDNDNPKRMKKLKDKKRVRRP